MLGYKRGPGVASRRAPPRISSWVPPAPGVGGIESHRGGVGCARRSVALGTTVSAPARLLQVHAPFALSLLVGLVVPLAPLTPPAAAALSQGSPLPPPLPAPVRVALRARFRARSAAQPILTPAAPDAAPGQPRWLMVDDPPVPPGDYIFRVVASSDAERALARAATRTAPISRSAFQGCHRRLFPLRHPNRRDRCRAGSQRRHAGHRSRRTVRHGPRPRRWVEVTWDAQPGSYGFQVLFNGQPVAQDSVSLDSPSRVIVAVDEAGAVTVKDTLRDTRLDITATDASGAPAPAPASRSSTRAGSCELKAAMPTMASLMVCCGCACQTARRRQLHPA